MSGRAARFFETLLRRRAAAAAALLLFSAGLGVLAARVRPDYSIEMAFPRFDRARVDYDRFKRDFPYDDAMAIVLVEAPDIFSPDGFRRLAALEADLGRIEGVVDTQGLATIRDIASDGVTIGTERLVPEPDLPPARLAEVRRIATTAPLFRWNLASPDGRATTIQVTLAPEHASTDATRTTFLHRARGVVAQHDAAARAAGIDQRLTLGGLPVIRSEFTELINADLGRLFPAALIVIALLLYASYRSAADVAAALITIVAAVLWTMGVMGLAGVPLHVLTQITPILVLIISISDTAHILTPYRDAVAAGGERRAALAAACAASAVPCLLTEITIAGGFVGLVFNDMVMIQQFGVVTAAGALLAWLANMTVLPLALSVSRAPVRRASPPAARALLTRAIRGVERMVVDRPRAVAVVAGLIVVAALVLAPRVGREYYAYDDLRPESELFGNLRRTEAVFGGSVPLAIFIEPAAGQPREPDAMLEPEALALIDRITRHLAATYPDDIRNVGSLSEYLRKAHALFTEGLPGAGELPATRRLAVQELTAVEEPRRLRHVVSSDRATAAIFAMVPDHGSTRASAVIAELRAVFDREEAQHPYRLTVTGIYGLGDAIYRSLVGGLSRSLGWAIAITFVMFALVLRSMRLAAIGLVPNLLPLLLTAALMTILGIALKPTTVIIFSIALVIADDDTIQYLTRFRRRYGELVRAGTPEPHARGALETLHDTGVPMLVTSLTVAVGFGALLLSEFEGLANLGLLLGVTLGVAFLADVFLAPLLLMTLRPRLSAAAPAPAPSPAAGEASRGPAP